MPKMRKNVANMKSNKIQQNQYSSPQLSLFCLQWKKIQLARVKAPKAMTACQCFADESRAIKLL